MTAPARPPWRRAALGVVAAAMTVAGCSGTAATLDRSATQRAVQRTVADAVEPGVVATTCPADLPREEGGRFRCAVRLAGGAGTVRASVRQTDDRGSLEVTLLDAVVSAEATASTLRTELRDQFERSFQVDCGSGWKVRKPEDTFTCTARDKTSRRTVEVTVADAAGTLRFVVRPA